LVPTRILLLRHGQSTWNAEGRWQGWSDPPLSPLGRAQAEEAAERLAGSGITGVVASDLDRALSTAEVVAATLGLGDAHIDPDLREYDVGDWEGLTRPEIETGWPRKLAAWREGRLVATPGGETRSAFLQRVTAALARVAADDLLGDVAAVVTHGGVLRAVEQVTGAPRSDVIGNLAGRWLVVPPAGGPQPGDRVDLLDEAHRTVPPSP
jgi:probable phosphoglycerate mutase